MPWKASSVMEERLRLVARLLDGEAMTDVCREFGVSRKTGYKIFDRYKELGVAERVSVNPRWKDKAFSIFFNQAYHSSYGPKAAKRAKASVRPLVLCKAQHHDRGCLSDRKLPAQSGRRGR